MTYLIQLSKNDVKTRLAELKKLAHKCSRDMKSAQKHFPTVWEKGGEPNFEFWSKEAAALFRIYL